MKTQVKITVQVGNASASQEIEIEVDELHQSPLAEEVAVGARNIALKGSKRG